MKASEAKKLLARNELDRRHAINSLYHSEVSLRAASLMSRVNWNEEYSGKAFESMQELIDQAKMHVKEAKAYLGVIR